MKLGSLFDGSGTCPLAASAVGINVPLVLVPCFGQASYDEYAPTEQAVTLKATGGNYGGGY